MSRQILFALLLMLNHSLLFGASQAAYIPDELHPFGSAFPHEHLHEHGHDDHDHGHGHDHDDHAHNMDQPLSTPDSPHVFDTAMAPDHDHDTTHSHGAHVPLNCDLPFSLSFALNTAHTEPPASSQHMHAGLAFAPPVPPPNV